MPDVDQYDYELPKSLIAQYPLRCRSDARLLVVDRRHNSLSHWHIRDLAELLKPTDCLVFNDTRVVPARLVGTRKRTGGRWQGLFLAAGEHGHWRILAKARGKIAPGENVTLSNSQGQDDISLKMVAQQPDGSWIVEPGSSESAWDLLDRLGRIPLPPYIRKGEMVESDRVAYQTVYARVPGAVAAPTAGLHFTPQLMHALKQKGVVSCMVTLHVGVGTFKPIATDSLAEHVMHYEWGQITPEVVATIQECRAKGGRVLAVGSTSTRLLETAAADGTLKPYSGETNLFIRPPYEFRAVDAMLTNFHLPRTTLLILVRTFGGDELMRRAYDEAIRQEYRFFSYGDAMLII